MGKLANMPRVAVLLVVTLLGSTVGDRVAAGPAPLPLATLFSGGFQLMDQNGVLRSSDEFRGRFMLIFFGYTYCPTICPTDLQHMAQALALLGDRARTVQPIFITVDPARDTPAVLREYLGHFGTRFLGLTGTEEQIRRTAKAYRVHRRKVVPDRSSPDEYLVDHSSLTLLIGPDGKFRTLFPHDTDARVMASRLEKYLDAD